ncbi:MAG: tetratricopeptide (TPR) repeat protein [Algoriphagus sp.]|jgi:tetratricopeptide (TPR) repeat protein
MKHVLSLLILVIFASTSFAQTTDSVAPKLDPNTKKVLNIQDQSAYQLAMRYNDFQAAKDKLFSLIIRNPEDLRYPELLGSLYFENEMATSAALVALDILQVNEKSIGSLEIAAFSLEQLGALDRALPHFERLFLLTGDNFSLYKSAFIQYNLKKYQEALNSVNMLSKNTKPDDKIGFPLSQTETQEIGMKAAALNLKGMIYLDQGSKAEAKLAFEEAIQLEPNFNLAKENLKKVM